MANSRFLLAMGIALCATAWTQAQAISSMGSQVVAIVPTICNVIHRGRVTDIGDGFGLGQLTEYCNASGGFSLYVEYTPGTLVGSQLTVDNRTIQLDGTGHAEIIRYQGPSIITSNISIKSGPSGFDSGFLSFAIHAY